MRAGRSGSLRDQPKELTESRKVVEAMIPVQTPADLIKREGYKHFFLGITTNGLVCSSASDARKKRCQSPATSAGTMHNGNHGVRADDLQVVVVVVAVVVGEHNGGPDDRGRHKERG